MEGKLPEKPEFSNSDNRDLTIALQQKQIDDLNKKVNVLQQENHMNLEKIKELHNIKRKVEETKKKNMTETLQGKYFHQKTIKLTWDLIVEICQFIMDGYSIEETCGNLGITRRTYQNWVRKATTAKSENDIYFALFTATATARNFEEKRYKNKVDEALFQYDIKNYFTEDEIKALPAEKRANLLIGINNQLAVKSKIALDMLRIRKPKKYNLANISITDETVILQNESTSKSKTETVEQAEVSNMITQLIKKKSVHVSILDDEDEQDDTEIVFE